MDHPKCATCKHFSPENSEWDVPDSFGLCRVMPETWEMSGWDEGWNNMVVRPEYTAHLAAVGDGSSYSAKFYVNEEFYCPMHSDLMPDLKPYRK